MQSAAPCPILRSPGREHEIALTFDDGPNPAVTPGLLDVLDHHHVRATFFLIGRFVRSCPNLAREIVLRGHAIGNHTDTHVSLTRVPSACVELELLKCQSAIVRATGVVPSWMRPPYGLYGPQVCGSVCGVGLRGIALWSVSCDDWNPKLPSELISRLASVGANKSGDIVLLHDGDHRNLSGARAHIIPALKYWLPRWIDLGYRFVTVPQTR